MARLVRARAAVRVVQLRRTVDDPAMIGYFLMNEPTWGFAAQTPGEGMLRNTPRCATREAMADWLAEKYAGEEAFAVAWGGASLDEVRGGAWQRPFTAAARADLEAFST
ncbi:MAG: hypothetical protein ACOC7V_02490, partial [Spirochaetota bacterium]